jgi:phosphopantetheine--protein transferase-like protein
MIRSLGIDAIEPDRFEQWTHYKTQQLQRIFSTSEIAYCFATPGKHAERLAVRFAAKEAFYKAFCSLISDVTLSFVTICRLVQVKHRGTTPTLQIDWPILCYKANISFKRPPHALLSLTHTKTQAIAVVALTN